MRRISKFLTLIILWIFRRKVSRIICNECSDPIIKVTEKWLSSLVEFSEKRNENGIYLLLIKSKTKNTQLLVHENCRKRFNGKRKLTTINTKDKRATRKLTSLFNWKQLFFFNQHCIEDYKNPSRRDWHLASTLQIRQADPKDE